MAKKRKFYTIETDLVFKGTFKIKAESKEQAQEHIQKHCGLVLGGNIHTTLPYGDADWSFSTHAEKIIK